MIEGRVGIVPMVRPISERRGGVCMYVFLSGR